MPTELEIEEYGPYILKTDDCFVIELGSERIALDFKEAKQIAEFILENGEFEE